MTPTTDPFDARAYDPFSIHLSHERDLIDADRDAVHTAAQTRRPFDRSERLMLLGIGVCLVLVIAIAGTEHVWRPLLDGWW